jgi:hypothetical protein
LETVLATKEKEKKEETAQKLKKNEIVRHFS